MKALRYDGPWKMSLIDLPTPEPDPGEVLLRSRVVGICGSDVHGFTGESGRRAPGMVMGHEVVADVEALGPGVESPQVGDRVTVFNIVGCGGCACCRGGRPQQCPDRRVLGVNGGQWGAMAEMFTFPAEGLFKVDPAVDPAVAVLTEPIAVATHAVNLMRPGPGDTVAIVGAGMIGTGLAIVLRDRDVERCFALDKVAEKLELIRAFGAEPIDVEKRDALEVIRSATDGAGAHGAFEAVGGAETVRIAYDVCGPGATVVLVGNLAQEFTLPLQGVTSRETVIRGSYGFTPKDFADAVDLINRRTLPLDRLISGHCTLEEAPKVMTDLARGDMQAMKMVIRF